MELVVSQYTKTIQGNTVLDRIDLNMTGGRIYGLRGENGSGKTMLLRAICGLIRPTGGFVEINGARLTEFPQSVGILIEEPDFIQGYTGLKNLLSIARIKGIAHKEDVENVLTEVGLNPGDKRPFRKYSLGMKKRLGVACALMENPDLILLDEPFNGLDEKGITLVASAIKKRADAGALCIVACHDRAILEEIADAVILMEAGRTQ